MSSFRLNARVTARGPHRIRNQVRHGEHGWPGVEGEAVDVEHARTAAGQLFPFDHGDVVRGPEVTRG